MTHLYFPSHKSFLSPLPAGNYTEQSKIMDTSDTKDQSGQCWHIMQWSWHYNN